MVFDFDSQKLEHMVRFFASRCLAAVEPLEFSFDFSFDLPTRQVDLVEYRIDIPDIFPEQVPLVFVSGLSAELWVLVNVTDFSFWR